MKEYKDDIINLLDNWKVNKHKQELIADELLILLDITKPENGICECGGNKRIALDCTMKPCKFKKSIK